MADRIAVYKKLYVKCDVCEGTESVRMGEYLGRCPDCKDGFKPFYVELEKEDR